MTVYKTKTFVEADADILDDVINNFLDDPSITPISVSDYVTEVFYDRDGKRRYYNCRLIYMENID